MFPELEGWVGEAPVVLRCLFKAGRIDLGFGEFVEVN